MLREFPGNIGLQLSCWIMCNRRRDLAVLLVHSGEFQRGKAELQAYVESPEAKNAPTETLLLVDRLMDMLDKQLLLDGPAQGRQGADGCHHRGQFPGSGTAGRGH